MIVKQLYQKQNNNSNNNNNNNNYKINIKETESPQTQTLPVSLITPTRTSIFTIISSRIMKHDFRENMEFQRMWLVNLMLKGTSSAFSIP